jgi:phytanoyl-CoA hydroxylase
MMSRIGSRELAKYREQGFLVLEGFVSREACDRLRARAAEMVARFEPGDTHTIFTTQHHARDEYFLASGGEVRFFFEEEALDAEGRLLRPKELSINKIGHAMHDLDPVFDAFSRTKDLAELSADLGHRDPLLLQSMYIFKQPNIGGEVNLHTDHTFLWSEPMSTTGYWIAIEDATLENGCLWALPGGHHIPVKRRFRRVGSTTRMDVLDESPYPREGEVPLEVEKGALIVLHPALPHRSGPNRSPRSRHAYTLHILERGAHYPEDNWLQRPKFPLKGF